MTRDTRVQAVAAVVLSVCVAISGWLSVSLTGMAGAAKLTYTDRAEEGAPVEQTFAIALGAFRGIFVNFLWIRANDMKEAGKFYDAIQLASTITKLQPRFPRVWVFHAWNMAYNISVTTETPEERWQWVNAGINLLRDKGVKANPNDMLIHKELAWIFLHKIGGFTDDANTYYKRMLAQEWTVVLGPPPMKSGADRDRTKAVQKYVDWLRVYADAPQAMEDCVKDEPAVAGLAEKIRTQVHVNLETTDDIYVFLYNYERAKAVSKSILRNEWETSMQGHEGALVLLGLVSDPANDKVFGALNAHLRKRLLVERYNMDPERMIKYTQKYGPIDWRHHAAHALYWSEKGVEAGEARVSIANKGDFDFVNTDRVVAQSVQDLFRTGELYFDFLTSTRAGNAFFQGVPNPHFVDSYVKIVDEEMRQRSDFDKTSGGYNHFYSPLSAGYENFVRDVIVFFYRRGEVTRAEEWLSKLRNYVNTNLNDPRRGQELSKPVGEFVKGELVDNLTRPSMMIQQVTGSLMGAFASGLLGRDPELFRSQVEYAKMAHRYFMEEQIRQTPAAGAAGPRMQQIDQDFAKVEGGLFYQFISALDIDDAHTAYSMAENGLKLYAYKPIVENFKEVLNKQGPKKFDEMFPEPEGYKAFLDKLRREFEDEQRRQNGPGKIEAK